MSLFLLQVTFFCTVLVTKLLRVFFELQNESTYNYLKLYKCLGLENKIVIVGFCFVINGKKFKYLL